MGESRVDHATMAFRLVLAEASEQEQARVDALMALWQRTVFAATWPSPNEAPRTLTNSHGESALPIFSGVDTLEIGANRFSWREPDGSIRFREMPAREALRYALARQVNFVVLDVGFEHAVEFALEEFEPLVAQREPTLPSTSDREAAVRDAVRRSNRPAGSLPPSASAPARLGSGPQVIQTRSAQHVEPLPARPHSVAPQSQSAANHQRSGLPSAQPPRAASQSRSPSAHAPPAAGQASAPRSQSASGPQLKQSLAPPQVSASSSGVPRQKMASGPQLKQSASSLPPQPSAAAGSRQSSTPRAQVASGPQLKQSATPDPQPSAAPAWPGNPSSSATTSGATASAAQADMLRQQPLSGPRLKQSSIPAVPEPPPPLAAGSTSSAKEDDAEQRPTARPVSGSELIAQPQQQRSDSDTPEADYSQHPDAPELHAANASPLPKSEAPRRDARRPLPTEPSAQETQRRLPVRTTPLPALEQQPLASANPTQPGGPPLQPSAATLPLLPGSPLPPPPSPGPRRRTTPLQLSAAEIPVVAPPQRETAARQPTAAMLTKPSPEAQPASRLPRQRPTTPLQLSISAEALFTPDALPPQEPSNQQHAETPLSYPPAASSRRATTPLQLSASAEALPYVDSATPAVPPAAAARRSHPTTPLQLSASAELNAPHYDPELSLPQHQAASPESRAALPTARPPRPNQQPKAAAELRRTPPPVPEAARSRAPSNPEGQAFEEPAPQPKPPALRRRRDDEPTLAERPNRIHTQRGVQASVPDSALEALSCELRSFPEVEWACVLFDESDVPQIGVRVDPSFLNRVADITDVILDTGERQSVTLQVLLLNNQEQVKNARRNGRAFYPWAEE